MVREKDEEDVKDIKEEESDSDDGASTSSDEPNVELMVNTRARRSTAGNKMSVLVESTMQEDEFYKSAYGGFNEDEVDTAFESPVQSDDDEVDSDFDRPEEEDEPISDNEEERRPKRKSAFREPARGSRDELLKKNKKWALARMGGAAVAANTVDAKTQEQRLKEAEITEKINIESLRKYEQFELERKKKRERAAVARVVPPPYFSFKSNANGNSIVVPSIKKFKSQIARGTTLCAVTHRPAKYRDPLTGLPYASSFAFKVIRDNYNKFLKKHKGDPDIAAYLENFE